MRSPWCGKPAAPSSCIRLGHMFFPAPVEQCIGCSPNLCFSTDLSQVPLRALLPHILTSEPRRLRSLVQSLTLSPVLCLCWETLFWNNGVKRHFICCRVPSCFFFLSVLCLLPHHPKLNKQEESLAEGSAEHLPTNMKTWV